ncbi:MAG: VCBS repeat-containing protein, partial [Candidatus Omnitrophica bacterium]|nr:VCBS repeat-containing protein [Candidatus Omnitrophota bacterium]
VRTWKGSGGTQVKVSLNTGSGFGAASNWDNTTSGNYTSWNLLLVDLNGDGRRDLVATWKDNDEGGSVGTRVKVRLNTGSGFDDWSFWDDTETGNFIPWAQQLVDMNGDLRPDLVQTYKGTDGTRVRVRLNTGSGFEAASYWDSTTSGNYTNYQIKLLDMNGDGLADFVRTWKGSNGTQVKVSLNTDNRLELIEQMDGQIAQRQAELADLAAQRDTIIAQRNEISAQIAEVNAQIASVQGQTDEVNAGISERVSQLADLAAQIATVSGGDYRTGQVFSWLEEAGAEQENLLAGSDFSVDLDQVTAFLEGQTQELTAEQTTLQAELATLTGVAGRAARDRRGEINRRLAWIEGWLAQKEAFLAAQPGIGDQIQAQIAALEAEQGGLVSELQGVAGDQASLDQAIGTLEESVATLGAELVSVEDQLKQLGAALPQQVKAVDDAVGRLNSEIASLGVSRNTLALALGSLNAPIAYSQDLIGALNQRISKLDKTLEKFHSSVYWRELILEKLDDAITAADKKYKDYARRYGKRSEAATKYLLYWSELKGFREWLSGRPNATKVQFMNALGDQEKVVKKWKDTGREAVPGAKEGALLGFLAIKSIVASAGRSISNSASRYDGERKDLVKERGDQTAKLNSLKSDQEKKSDDLEKLDKAIALKEVEREKQAASLEGLNEPIASLLRKKSELADKISDLKDEIAELSEQRDHLVQSQDSVGQQAADADSRIAALSGDAGWVGAVKEWLAAQRGELEANPLYASAARDLDAAWATGAFTGLDELEGYLKANPSATAGQAQGFLAARSGAVLAQQASLLTELAALTGATAAGRNRQREIARQLAWIGGWLAKKEAFLAQQAAAGQTIQEQIATLQAEKSQLVSELPALRESQTNLAQALAARQQSLSSLIAQRDAKLTQAAALAGETIPELMEQRDRLNGEIALLDQRIAPLQTGLNTLQQRWITAHLNVTANQNGLDAVNSLINTANSQLASTNSRINALYNGIEQTQGLFKFKQNGTIKVQILSESSNKAGLNTFGYYQTTVTSRREFVPWKGWQEIREVTTGHHQRLFEGSQGAGVVRSFQVSAGQEFGFYLQEGPLVAWGWPGEEKPYYHTQTRFNTDKTRNFVRGAGWVAGEGAVEHARISYDAGRHGWIVRWEDQDGGGDQDFNDMVVLITYNVEPLLNAKVSLNNTLAQLAPQQNAWQTALNRALIQQAEIQGGINGTTTVLNGLLGERNPLVSQRDGLNNQIAQGETQQAALSSEISPLNGLIGSLQDQVEALEGELGAVMGAINQRDQRIAEIDGQLTLMGTDGYRVSQERAWLSAQEGPILDELSDLEGEEIVKLGLAFPEIGAGARSVTTDLFGNRTASITQTTYTVVKNRPLADAVTSYAFTAGSDLTETVSVSRLAYEYDPETTRLTRAFEPQDKPFTVNEADLSAMTPGRGWDLNGDGDFTDTIQGTGSLTVSRDPFGTVTVSRANVMTYDIQQGRPLPLTTVTRTETYQFDRTRVVSENQVQNSYTTGAEVTEAMRADGEIDDAELASILPEVEPASRRRYLNPAALQLITGLLKGVLETLPASPTILFSPEFLAAFPGADLEPGARSRSEDPFGTVTYALTQAQYVAANGRSLTSETLSRSTTLSFDGTLSMSVSGSRNQYTTGAEVVDLNGNGVVSDEELAQILPQVHPENRRMYLDSAGLIIIPGLLKTVSDAGAPGAVTVTLDPFGTTSIAEAATTEFQVVRGRGLALAVENRIETVAFDGAQSTSLSVLRYAYDPATGYLKTDGTGVTEEAPAASFGVDALGNVTETQISTVYIVVNNRPLADTVETASLSFGFDGTESQSLSRLHYNYDPATALITTDGAGVIEEAVTLSAFDREIKDYAGTASLSRDFYGNVTENRSATLYLVANNRPLADTVETAAASFGFDGTDSASKSRLSYRYDPITTLLTGVVEEEVTLEAFGIPVGPVNGSVSISRDAFGNRTSSVTQTDYLVLNNRPLAAASATTSEQTGVDGTLGASAQKLVFAYNAQGFLETGDLNGDGQPDGIREEEAGAILPAGRTGRPQDLTHQGTGSVSVSLDPTGTITRSVTRTEEWVILKNRPLARVTDTLSDATSLDLALSLSRSRIENNYDPDTARLASARELEASLTGALALGVSELLLGVDFAGDGLDPSGISGVGTVSVTRDPYDSISASMSATSSFLLLKGRALPRAVATESAGWSADGTQSRNASFVGYQYDPDTTHLTQAENGPVQVQFAGQTVSSPEASSVNISVDLFGGTSKTVTVNSYDVIANRARTRLTLSRTEAGGVEGTTSLTASGVETTLDPVSGLAAATLDPVKDLLLDQLDLSAFSAGDRQTARALLGELTEYSPDGRVSSVTAALSSISDLQGAALTTQAVTASLTETNYRNFTDAPGLWKVDTTVTSSKTQELDGSRSAARSGQRILYDEFTRVSGAEDPWLVLSFDSNANPAALGLKTFSGYASSVSMRADMEGNISRTIVRNDYAIAGGLLKAIVTNTVTQQVTFEGTPSITVTRLDASYAGTAGAADPPIAGLANTHPMAAPYLASGQPRELWLIEDDPAAPGKYRVRPIYVSLLTGRIFAGIKWQETETDIQGDAALQEWVRLQGLENEIGNLNTQIANLDNEIAGVDRQIAFLQGDVYWRQEMLKWLTTTHAQLTSDEGRLYDSSAKGWDYWRPIVISHGKIYFLSRAISWLKQNPNATRDQFNAQLPAILQQVYAYYEGLPKPPGVKWDDFPSLKRLEKSGANQALAMMGPADVAIGRSVADQVVKLLEGRSPKVTQRDAKVQSLLTLMTLEAGLQAQLEVFGGNWESYLAQAAQAGAGTARAVTLDDLRAERSSIDAQITQARRELAENTGALAQADEQLSGIGQRIAEISAAAAGLLAPLEAELDELMGNLGKEELTARRGEINQRIGEIIQIMESESDDPNVDYDALVSEWMNLVELRTGLKADAALVGDQMVQFQAERDVLEGRAATVQDGIAKIKTDQAAAQERLAQFDQEIAQRQGERDGLVSALAAGDGRIAQVQLQLADLRGQVTAKIAGLRTYWEGQLDKYRRRPGQGQVREAEWYRMRATAALHFLRMAEDSLKADQSLQQMVNDLASPPADPYTYNSSNATTRRFYREGWKLAKDALVDHLNTQGLKTRDSNLRAEMISLRADRASKLGEIAAVDTRITQAQASRNDLVGQVSSFNQQLAAAEADLAGLNQDLKLLNTQIPMAQRAADLLDQIRTAHAGLAAQLEPLTAEQDRLLQARPDLQLQQMAAGDQINAMTFKRNFLDIQIASHPQSFAGQGATITLGSDLSGNMTSTVTRNQRVILLGQSVVAGTATTTTTTGIDGGTSTQTSRTAYQFDLVNGILQMVGAQQVGVGAITSVDRNGNVTHGTFTNTQEVIAGRPVITSTVTHSVSDAALGDRPNDALGVVTDVTTDFVYDQVTGRLLGGTSTSITTETDAATRRVTTSRTDQFLNDRGRPVSGVITTVMDNPADNNSRQETVIDMDFTYSAGGETAAQIARAGGLGYLTADLRAIRAEFLDENGEFRSGLLIGAQGAGATTGVNNLGHTFAGTLSQSFFIGTAGQQLLGHTLEDRLVLNPANNTSQVVRTEWFAGSGPTAGDPLGKSGWLAAYDLLGRQLTWNLTTTKINDPSRDPRSTATANGHQSFRTDTVSWRAGQYDLDPNNAQPVLVGSPYLGTTDQVAGFLQTTRAQAATSGPGGASAAIDVTDTQLAQGMRYWSREDFESGRANLASVGKLRDSIQWTHSASRPGIWTKESTTDMRYNPLGLIDTFIRRGEEHFFLISGSSYFDRNGNNPADWRLRMHTGPTAHAVTGNGGLMVHVTESQRERTDYNAQGLAIRTLDLTTFDSDFTGRYRDFEAVRDATLSYDSDGQMTGQIIRQSRSYLINGSGFRESKTDTKTGIAYLGLTGLELSYSSFTPPWAAEEDGKAVSIQFGLGPGRSPPVYNSLGQLVDQTVLNHTAGEAAETRQIAIAYDAWDSVSSFESRTDDDEPLTVFSGSLYDAAGRRQGVSVSIVETDDGGFLGSGLGASDVTAITTTITDAAGRKTSESTDIEGGGGFMSVINKIVAFAAAALVTWFLGPQAGLIVGKLMLAITFAILSAVFTQLMNYGATGNFDFVAVGISVAVAIVTYGIGKGLEKLGESMGSTVNAAGEVTGESAVGNALAFTGNRLASAAAIGSWGEFGRAVLTNFLVSTVQWAIANAIFTEEEQMGVEGEEPGFWKVALNFVLSRAASVIGYGISFGEGDKWDLSFEGGFDLQDVVLISIAAFGLIQAGISYGLQKIQEKNGKDFKYARDFFNEVAANVLDGLGAMIRSNITTETKSEVLGQREELKAKQTELKAQGAGEVRLHRVEKKIGQLDSKLKAIEWILKNNKDNPLLKEEKNFETLPVTLKEKKEKGPDGKRQIQHDARSVNDPKTGLPLGNAVGTPLVNNVSDLKRLNPKIDLKEAEKHFKFEGTRPVSVEKDTEGNITVTFGPGFYEVNGKRMEFVTGFQVLIEASGKVEIKEGQEYLTARPQGVFSWKNRVYEVVREPGKKHTILKEMNIDPKLLMKAMEYLMDPKVKLLPGPGAGKTQVIELKVPEAPAGKSSRAPTQEDVWKVFWGPRDPKDGSRTPYQIRQMAGGSIRGEKVVVVASDSDMTENKREVVDVAPPDMTGENFLMGAMAAADKNPETYDPNTNTLVSEPTVPEDQKALAVELAEVFLDPKSKQGMELLGKGLEGKLEPASAIRLEFSEENPFQVKVYAILKGETQETFLGVLDRRSGLFLVSEAVDQGQNRKNHALAVQLMGMDPNRAGAITFIFTELEGGKEGEQVVDSIRVDLSKLSEAEKDDLQGFLATLFTDGASQEAMKRMAPALAAEIKEGSVLIFKVADQKNPARLEVHAELKEVGEKFLGVLDRSKGIFVPSFDLVKHSKQMALELMGMKKELAAKLAQKEILFTFTKEAPGGLVKTMELKAISKEDLSSAPALKPLAEKLFEKVEAGSLDLTVDVERPDWAKLSAQIKGSTGKTFLGVVNLESGTFIPSMKLVQDLGKEAALELIGLDTEAAKRLAVKAEFEEGSDGLVKSVTFEKAAQEDLKLIMKGFGDEKLLKALPEVELTVEIEMVNPGELKVYLGPAKKESKDHFSIDVNSGKITQVSAPLLAAAAETKEVNLAPAKAEELIKAAPVLLKALKELGEKVSQVEITEEGAFLVTRKDVEGEDGKPVVLEVKRAPEKKGEEDSLVLSPVAAEKLLKGLDALGTMEASLLVAIKGDVELKEEGSLKVKVELALKVGEVKESLEVELEISEGPKKVKTLVVMEESEFEELTAPEAKALKKAVEEDLGGEILLILEEESGEEATLQVKVKDIIGEELPPLKFKSKESEEKFLKNAELLKKKLDEGTTSLKENSDVTLRADLEDGSIRMGISGSDLMGEAAEGELAGIKLSLHAAGGKLFVEVDEEAFKELSEADQQKLKDAVKELLGADLVLTRESADETKASELKKEVTRLAKASKLTPAEARALLAKMGTAVITGNLTKLLAASGNKELEAKIQKAAKDLAKFFAVEGLLEAADTLGVGVNAEGKLVITGTVKLESLNPEVKKTMAKLLAQAGYTKEQMAKLDLRFEFDPENPGTLSLSFKVEAKNAGQLLVAVVNAIGEIQVEGVTGEELKAAVSKEIAKQLTLAVDVNSIERALTEGGKKTLTPEQAEALKTLKGAFAKIENTQDLMQEVAKAFRALAELGMIKGDVTVKVDVTKEGEVVGLSLKGQIKTQALSQDLQALAQAADPGKKEISFELKIQVDKEKGTADTKFMFEFVVKNTQENNTRVSSFVEKLQEVGGSKEGQALWGALVKNLLKEVNGTAQKEMDLKKIDSIQIKVSADLAYAEAVVYFKAEDLLAVAVEETAGRRIMELTPFAKSLKIGEALEGKLQTLGLSPEIIERVAIQAASGEEASSLKEIYLLGMDELLKKEKGTTLDKAFETLLKDLGLKELPAGLRIKIQFSKEGWAFLVADRMAEAGAERPLTLKDLPQDLQELHRLDAQGRPLSPETPIRLQVLLANPDGVSVAEEARIILEAKEGEFSRPLKASPAAPSAERLMAELAAEILVETPASGLVDVSGWKRTKHPFAWKKVEYEDLEKTFPAPVLADLKETAKGKKLMVQLDPVTGGITIHRRNPWYMLVLGVSSTPWRLVGAVVPSGQGASYKVYSLETVQSYDADGRRITPRDETGRPMPVFRADLDERLLELVKEEGLTEFFLDAPGLPGFRFARLAEEGRSLETGVLVIDPKSGKEELARDLIYVAAPTMEGDRPALLSDRMVKARQVAGLLLDANTRTHRAVFSGDSAANTLRFSRFLKEKKDGKPGEMELSDSHEYAAFYRAEGTVKITKQGVAVDDEKVREMEPDESGKTPWLRLVIHPIFEEDEKGKPRSSQVAYFIPEGTKRGDIAVVVPMEVNGKIRDVTVRPYAAGADRADALLFIPDEKGALTLTGKVSIAAGEARVWLLDSVVGRGGMEAKGSLLLSGETNEKGAVLLSKLTRQFEERTSGQRYWLKHEVIHVESSLPVAVQGPLTIEGGEAGRYMDPDNLQYEKISIASDGALMKAERTGQVAPNGASRTFQQYDEALADWKEITADRIKELSTNDKPVYGLLAEGKAKVLEHNADNTTAEQESTALRLYNATGERVGTAYRWNDTQPWRTPHAFTTPGQIVLFDAGQTYQRDKVSNYVDGDGLQLAKVVIG